MAAAAALVQVSGAPLELGTYTGFVEDAGAGAVATFTGTTRDNFAGKTVTHLEYEAYVPMAEQKLQVAAQPRTASSLTCAARALN